jgi:trigger factor
LPEEFLKRWLIESNRDNNEITPEQVEKEFVTLKESFKWQLIENYLIKENNIEVKHEEVSDYLKNYMRQQLNAIWSVRILMKKY